MKKLFLATALLVSALSLFAQEEEETPKGGFQKERVFVGASLGLGLGSGTFNVGVNPEVGYSITNWLDAGVTMNFNYASIKADYNYGYRQRSTTYGGGVFVRLHAFKGFFVQALPNTIGLTPTESL